MHRTSLSLFAVLALMLGLIPAAGAIVPQPVLPGVGITTDNVEHVGHIADVGPTVSARAVTVDDQRRLYVSSIGRGLSIYDIDDPEAPELLGALPVPTWQNEDMAVSEDGSIVILAQGDSNDYTANLVIDASDPLLPELVGITDGGDHTAECVTADCSFAWGSEGFIYDLSDPSDPQTVGDWIQMARDQGVPMATSGINQYPHKVVLDDAGYVISDSWPRVVFDVDDPAQPKVVTWAQHSGPGFNQAQIRYQHNNLRPLAAEYEPREPDDDDPALRAGELLLANGESNIVPECDGAGGPFMTWDMQRFDEGRQPTLINTFRPLDNGDYLDGNPAVNALGCSGHWFDWTTHDEGDTYTVAAAWFEHGVRFLEVEAATGEISEVGFFQPVNGSSGATYWINEEYVYVTDYVRGIDILKFSPDPDLYPTQAQLDANWLAGLSLPTLPQTAAYQAVCFLR